MIVLCVNTGNKYSIEYVRKLYNMVLRNLTKKFEFVCLTDKPEYYIHLPIKTIKLEKSYNSWWDKLNIFKTESNINNTILYLDLDVVIVNNLDEMIDKHLNNLNNDVYNIVMPKDWKTDVYNSSVMLFISGSLYNLYLNFIRNPDKYIQSMTGDQDYITSKLKDKICRFEKEEITSFKYDKVLELNTKNKIVIFQGYPKPINVNTDWVVKN